MRPKLATLSALESIAGLARRLGLGFLVDRLAPLIGRPFERFELDVNGVRLAGTELAHLHYVRELLEHGRERTFVRLLAESTPAGGVVVEGGAYLGFMTVQAALAVGSGGRVIVFEPNTAIHDLLRQNLRANGVEDRVELLPLALGGEAGRARFFLGEDMSNLFESPAGGEDSTEVEIVRADDLVTGSVDVVKLDVEGAEAAALRGMERILTGEGRPGALLVECYPALLERAGSSREELLAILEGHGYLVEWIDEAAGRTKPLSEAWTEDYVNLYCSRSS
jgi:FkbM family methyltransferase